jgi:phosphoglucosamine mutase
VQLENWRVILVNRKYFGTDGIRGVVGKSHVNPEFVLKLGWAFGMVLTESYPGAKKVLIGKDTRVSGYMFESALEAGLSAAGVDVRLLGPMPTPAVAYLTQTLRATAGIVISASHNLFEDNGIKFFAQDGSKLHDNFELAIENKIAQPMEVVSSAKLGKVKRVVDAAGRYIEFCKSTVSNFTRLTGLKIVVDCANGATYHVAPDVFLELGAEVIPLFNKPDGFNINANCGSTSPQVLRQKVLDTKADIGIGLDGDGDRLVLIDSLGNILTGDHILYIIASDRLKRGVPISGVVGTVLSNLGLELALNKLGLNFNRTKVGDRNILEALKTYDWHLGGEPSGHIVCLDKTTTGDGIVAALQVLSMMVRYNKGLSELTTGLDLLPQCMLNFATSNAHILLNDSRVKLGMQDLENFFGDKGRVILRASGTEPLLRIMVEGIDEVTVNNKAHDLLQYIKDIDNTLSSNKINT